jgi:hypothetical protein
MQAAEGTMETKWHGDDIVEITGNTAAITTVEDVFAVCFIHNCSTVLIQKEHLAPDFFDLSTGMAGELLQKFSTYRKRLAIIGDYTAITSKPLKDFIRESNRTKQILFAATREEALRIFNMSADAPSNAG